MRLPSFLLVFAVAAIAPCGEQVLGAQVQTAEYAQRRTALAAKMQDGVLLAIGAQEPAQDYLSFYQTEPFTYLTGYQEPNAALVIVKRGGQTSSMLFVEEKDPAAEVWTGLENRGLLSPEEKVESRSVRASAAACGPP